MKKRSIEEEGKQESSFLEKIDFEYKNFILREKSLGESFESQDDDDDFENEFTMNNESSATSPSSSSGFKIINFKHNNQDEDSDDFEEWETVQYSTLITEEPLIQEDASSTTLIPDMEYPPNSGADPSGVLEITIPKISYEEQKKGISAKDRYIRLMTHKTHFLCLLATALLLNRSTLPNKTSQTGQILKESITKRVRDVVNNLNLKGLSILSGYWYKTYKANGEQVTDYINSMIGYPNPSCPSTEPTAFHDVKEPSSQYLGSNSLKISKTSQSTTFVSFHELNESLKTKLDSYSSNNVKDDIVSCIDDTSLLLAYSKYISSPEEEPLPFTLKTLGFIAVARSFGFKVRQVSALYPIPLSFSRHYKQYIYPIKTWCEVYLDNRWIPVDVIQGKMDKRHAIDAGKSVYILGIDEDFTVEDLTVYYTKDYDTRLKRRMEPEWLEMMLWYYSKGGVEERVRQEQNRIQERLVQGMPNNLSGFKNHEFYVLEKHLKRNEAVYPRKVIGHFKGQNVYSRADVKMLFSKERWKREGKQIKKDEEPYKEDLFGEWQVENYVPPILKQDELIPVNEYGNIEIFHERMIPIGCVHVDAPNIKSVAKELGIQVVPAVTGFSFGARNHPIMVGVIVKECDMEILREAVNEAVRSNPKKPTKRQKR